MTLRICHLSPTYFASESIIGGGERYVYNLARAIAIAARAGSHPIEQTVIAASDRRQEFDYEGTRVLLLPNISSSASNMDALPDGLWHVLPEYDLAHVHQSLTKFGEYAIATASSLAIPIVATDLGGGSSELMLFGKGLELADCVLSISDYARSLVGGASNAVHEVLIGPVDTDYFCSAGSSNHQERTYAICVGRILPHKGIDRIIRALPQGVALKVVGQVYDQRYYTLLRQLASDKQVEFIQDADDRTLLALYRGASLFLQGSTHRDIFGNEIRKPELMGLTTLEAMCCGLPVIVSDAGSLPELVRDSRFGRVFHDEAHLNQLLVDYSQRRWPEADMSAVARQSVIDNHGFMTIGQRLIETYLKTIELRNRS